jgi:hypothetical protein
VNGKGFSGGGINLPQIAHQAIINASLHGLMVCQESPTLGALGQMTIYFFPLCIGEGLVNVTNQLLFTRMVAHRTILSSAPLSSVRLSGVRAARRRWYAKRTRDWAVGIGQFIISAISE